MAKKENIKTQIDMTDEQIKNLEFTEGEISTLIIQHQTLTQHRGKLISLYAQELKVPPNWRFDEAKRTFVPPKEPPKKPEVIKDGKRI